MINFEQKPKTIHQMGNWVIGWGRRRVPTPVEGILRKMTTLRSPQMC